jgi:hypothetical protein
MKPDRLRLAIPAALTVFIVLVTLSCVWIPNVRPALKFSPDDLPEAQVGVAYTADILVTQNKTPVGDAWVSDGTLPGGLTLEKVPSQDVIRIHGTPLEAGTSAFTVAVWCYGTSVNGQMGNKQYTLTVNP